MRIKIISDGTAVGTRVVDRDTGEQLRNVIGIRWRIADYDDRAIAQIEFSNVEVELEAEVKN